MQKILVVKLSSLGDLFHPLPAIRCIKKAVGAQIDWVTQPEYVDLVGCFDDVNNVIPFYRRDFFKRIPFFLKTLRKESYDLVLDFQGLLKSALVTRSARAALRIGPSFQREGAALLYDETAGSKDATRHAVEKCLDLARHLKAEISKIEFPVTFPEVNMEEPRPRIAIIPGARWPTKRWPTEKFAETGRILREKLDASIFVFGSGDETGLCDKIAETLENRVVNLGGRTTLPEMGARLAEMDMVICNDSGPMHMAAALGTPVAAVFGPTDPSRTGPYGKNNIVLTSGTACRPCFSKKCGEGNNTCISDITTDMMVSAAMRLYSDKNH